MGEKVISRHNARSRDSGKQARNRINRDIRCPMVFLIDHEGTKIGEIRTSEALEMAREAGLDLVELQPNNKPPVAKIMDYGKHTFQQKKVQKAVKPKKLKEIKFRPRTDIGDYEVKLRNLRGFLESGSKVKVTVFFRGREMSHKQLGIELLDRVKKDLEDISKVDYLPKIEGRQLIMVLSPNKK